MLKIWGIYDYYAVYEPNQVNITWDDGSGNTNSTTCDYNDEFVLPEPPTRVGYTFTGWKVKSE